MAKYNDTSFTFETRTLNGMLYLTASAFNGSIKYEIKWDERKATNNLYIQQLLHDIRANNVKLSKPDIHSHCAPSSLMISHTIHPTNSNTSTFQHSYELKYTLSSDVDELIENHKFIDSFQSELKSIKKSATP